MDEIFSEYAYFSSYSAVWLQHSSYVEAMVEHFGLDEHSRRGAGQQGGYLLQYMVEKRIPCIGIEPAANVAEEAK